MQINYQELGFKCGLECHQQLEGKKLFCNCPTLNSNKEPDIKFVRKLKAVAGETGDIDIAAEFEMLKNKKIIYEGNSEDICLVEQDDEPPHELNKKALETTLKVALLLNAKIVDEIQVMRKTVVDGSNVSGFQRTALVAMDGFVESSFGMVKIPTICLEEEAAQKIEDGKDFVKYRLDRLGIPLIEIATSSEIKNPEHAKEVASHIGMVLRSVEGIKRGLGTIRQDVNISIKEGERTEVKGFQDLRSIPKVIEYEVKRQLDAIKQGKKLEKEVRKADPDFTTSFLRPLPGAARLYPETDCLPVKIEKKHIEKLRKGLPKLLTEKVDEFKNRYNLDEGIVKKIIEQQQKFNFERLVNPSRLLILDKIQKDFSVIDNLTKTMGLPLNQIKKIQEMSKSFESIIGNVNVHFDQIKKAQQQLETVRNVLIHTTNPINAALDRLEQISKLIETPKIAARTLTQILPEVEKEGVNPNNINENDIKNILTLIADDKISKESIPEILKEINKGKEIKDIIEKFSLISDKDLEEEIKKIIEEKPGLNVGAYMGLIMAKYRGKVDGKKVMEMLKALVKQAL